MISIILIAFISLIALLALHEFSHFAAAKKFGADVEEFGIGYPPRLVAKKINNTLYSLNLLPFGAFVKIPPEKMKSLPIWQRAIILGAGIVSFWIICAILLAIIFSVGSAMQVSDTENDNLIDPRVQIMAIASGSPAENAGLLVGDVIRQLTVNHEQLMIDKVQQIQGLVQQYGGTEIFITFQRGSEILETNLVPRIAPPQGQGPLGVGLVRVATQKYPLFTAIFQGAITTVKLTGQIVSGFFQAIKRLVLREPSGVELVGPVGVLNIFVNAGILGPIYFLQTVAIISLNAAVINALPIPVADGGKVLLLALEKIRKKPLNEKIEQSINTVFFGLLIVLMIWVTIKDFNRLF